MDGRDFWEGLRRRRAPLVGRFWDHNDCARTATIKRRADYPFYPGNWCVFVGERLQVEMDFLCSLYVLEFRLRLC